MMLKEIFQHFAKLKYRHVLRICYGMVSFVFCTQTVFAQTTSNATPSKTADQVENLLGSIIGAFPLWITGGLIIVISFVLARIVKASVENKMSEEGLEEEHQEVQIVAGRVASAVVLIVGITVGLKVAGIDLTSVLAAGAFGVGFAMKDIIVNFLAGIGVLIQKQFTIGDWIKVGSTVGVIQQIQSRYTVIKAFDGTKIIIPNADLFKKQVTSYTSNPYRRFTVTLGVDLYQDLKEVVDLIYTSVKKIPGILQYPKPRVMVAEPGSFANTIKVHCWVESRKGILKPKNRLIRQLHKDFYERGWSWPYPTQALIFDKDVPPDVNTRAKHYIDQHKHKEVAPTQLPAENSTHASMPAIPVAVPPIMQDQPVAPQTILPLPD